MLKLRFNPRKIFIFSKNTLLPLLIMAISTVYFCAVSEFSEGIYHSLHLLFLTVTVMAFLSASFFKIPCIALSVSVIYVSYVIVNSMRYVHGEDYMFSAGYNVWCMLMLPNILLIYLFFYKNKPYKYWSFCYVALFLETALIERLQNQSIDADSSYFYHHVGMLNYPALVISVICIVALFLGQMAKGKILCATMLYCSVSAFSGMYFSDNLFAFCLFFFTASLIALVMAVYYKHYISYKDEELNIPNIKMFFNEADKKFPLKYSIVLMYIDEYERLLKRFGESKMLSLKKMFLAQISQTNSKVLIYNYRTDALILAFKNSNASECFGYAEDIRRVLAKSIFVFNENNHLQLTVSQCVSEKKRSDANSQEVLLRAEENLQKACKFTRNITIKA